MYSTCKHADIHTTAKRSISQARGHQDCYETLVRCIFALCWPAVRDPYVATIISVQSQKISDSPGWFRSHRTLALVTHLYSSFVVVATWRRVTSPSRRHGRPPRPGRASIFSARMKRRTKCLVCLQRQAMPNETRMARWSKRLLSKARTQSLAAFRLTVAGSVSRLDVLQNLQDGNFQKPALTLSCLAFSRASGNTRVISQDALTHFRDSLAAKQADPYSVVLKQNKLPMSLLQDSTKVSLSLLLHRARLVG